MLKRYVYTRGSDTHMRPTQGVFTPNKAYELDVVSFSGMTHIRDDMNVLTLISDIGVYNAEWQWCDETGSPIPQPSIQIAITIITDDDRKFILPPPILRSFRFNAAPQWIDAMLCYTPDYAPYAVHPRTGEAHMVLFTESGW